MASFSALNPRDDRADGAPPGPHQRRDRGLAGHAGQPRDRVLERAGVLLFTYAFGGAVHVQGTARYIVYLLTGIFVLSIGFGAS